MLRSEQRRIDYIDTVGYFSARFYKHRMYDGDNYYLGEDGACAQYFQSGRMYRTVI